MLVTRKIADVEIGGNASDNPSPFGLSNFDFDANQINLTYHNVNVIVYHKTLEEYVQVTGKVNVDSMGAPLMGDNDDVYLPCPPFCDQDD